LGGLSAHLSLGEYALILLAAFVGATVQSSIGFGSSLVAVPVVALFVPEALPATAVVWSMPLVAAMMLRERQAIDRPGLRWMTIGRIPGAALGAWVVTAVAVDTLSVLTGLAVLVAVAMSVLGAALAITPATSTGAGFAAGLMGTSTGIDGPPMALLYQHREGPVMRSTLGAAFVIGQVISVTGLAVTRAVEVWQLLLALALVPSHVGGMVTSRWLIGRLDRRWLRPAVLVFAAATAMVAVIRGLA
jgi:uncharacterized membrane protein YfcA